MKTVLIAIGGNALFDLENGNNVDPHKINSVCADLVKVVSSGYQPVITFGNGPQVGNLLEMSERYTLPPRWPIPLDVCVAWTQAELGYFLTKELQNQLHRLGVDVPIIGVNTTVVVDANDPAFINPTKPVGNFYNKDEAEALSVERGWQMREDSGRGWRRVVPSPRPVRIIEEEAIRSLVQSGAIVLCGGGGGIPVAQEEGLFRGVEAVIDKDYTACLLAMRLEIPELVICTAVDKVYLNYGTPQAVPLDTVTLEDARKYLAEGQFPPGSMGPKVDALLRFIEDGGERAILTRLENLANALAGQTGTQFVIGTRSVKFKV